MSRKAFLIWFVVFTLLQWPWASIMFGLCRTIEQMVVSMAFSAILFSGITGIIICAIIISQIITGTNSIFIESTLWTNYVLFSLMVVVVSVHLYFSIRRCKDAGVSRWLALLPLYNPIAILMKGKQINYKHSLQGKATKGEQ